MWGALVICCIIYAYIGVNDNELGFSINSLLMILSKAPLF